MEKLESYLEKDGRITTGQMADICGLTKRALRLYHEKGLLSPVFHDEDTGYRYYSLCQIPRADRIARLQNLGFTLSEIGELLLGMSLNNERELYARKVSEVRAEKARLSVAEQLLREHLEIEGFSEDLVVSGVSLKWKPERTFVVINLEGCGVQLASEHTEEGALAWYYTMALMREHIQKLGLPAVVCNHISTMISPENLAQRNFRVDRACVTVPQQYLPLEEDTLVIPEGFVVYATAQTFFDDSGKSSEVAGIENLLDYISAHNFAIRGSYMGIGDVDEEITGRLGGTFDRLRFEIPVALPN